MNRWKMIARKTPRLARIMTSFAALYLASAVSTQDGAVITRCPVTGIAVSACSLGGGVNAANIKKCLAILRDSGYDGVLSIECEGQGGPMIEQSLRWLRATLKELGIKETK